MLNKKSFDLNKDEKKTKTTERLYQPKKFRWCKYIVLPLLFGFILLLILTNVDFTGEAYNQHFAPPNGRMSTPDNTMRGTLSKIKSSISRALNCIQSTDSCSLTCVGGTINNIYKQLEPLYKSCNRDLDLTLIDCSLPSGRLKNDFFQGNYHLKTINITNCNLAAIQNKAFAQESVKNLKNLTLINAQFVTLDKTAFEGLQQLEYFEMINKISWSTFKGNGLLTYFSETLTSLIIQQEAVATSIYDPLNWLQGATMNRLTSVNLANNNFQNILKAHTFGTLIAVEYLQLSNCYLTYLEANVFDVILKTLKHLDLSNNQLTTLPAEMLWRMSGLELNVSFNYWQCTCEDNKDMLQIIKWKLVDIVFLDERNIKCYTPSEWKDVCVDHLVLECLVSTTVEISDTTIGEITENETDETSTVPTTTIISPSNSTATTKVTQRPTKITTETSSKISSTSDSISSSSESSSSSQTSEETETETNEPSSESIESTTSTTTARTTRFTTTTTAATPIATTSTPSISTPSTSTPSTSTPSTSTPSTSTPSTSTPSTSTPSTSTATTSIAITTTTTPAPDVYILCYDKDNKPYIHPVLKAKSTFAIKPISATSVKIVTNNLLSNISVLCFSNVTNSTVVSEMKRQKHEYFAIINNLNSSQIYTFCLLQQIMETPTVIYNWNISPFDCRSYSRPEILPQPWLETEDEVWIISVVVLAACLMLFLGIILVVVITRWRKHKNKYKRTLNRDVEIEPNYLEPTNGLCNRNCDVIVRPGRLYISQCQPPDVLAQHLNCNSNNNLYEELIM